MSRVPYASAVGSLMFAMICTRPDIAQAVGAVSRYMANPGREHWITVKRILRYIRGTSDVALCYGGSEFTVRGYVDSDFAGNLDKRKSTTGYVFALAGATVSWVSKLQTVVALSTTEAEYMAATQACKEAIWIQRLLEELGHKQQKIPVFCDSQSALHIARNPAFSFQDKAHRSPVSLRENKAGNPELIQKVLEKYAKVLPPFFLDIVQRSDVSTLHWAPLMFRHPWNVFFGNLSKGNVTVAGDAMHPMTPELGQGGCQALEDAVVLGRHIGNLLIKTKGHIATTGDNNVAQAIDGYVKERKWRVTGLVIGSYFSGWLQIGGSNWWMKFLRDVIFYRTLLGGLLFKIAGYDCGKLPVVSLGENDNPCKID
ncbi:hypothetical protein KPL70_021723 [Citrus sinensis]|nr:hypothetical protein KPL70_021723 [Citrus sinensis]